MLRLLFGAWLIPAAALMWIGLAATGLRAVDPSALGLALGRTQAMAVLLAVFTVLIGASAFVRRPQLVPAPPVDSGHRRGPSPAPSPLLHLSALVTAAISILAAGALGSAGSALWSLAALSAFAAGLYLPRALVRLPCPWAGPLAALAAGMVFQLTVGWLHVVHPAGMASPALIIEGLILAWASVAAARVGLHPVPAAGVEPGADDTAVELVVSGSGFSPTSAPPSFVEPVVGH